MRPATSIECQCARTSFWHSHSSTSRSAFVSVAVRRFGADGPADRQGLPDGVCRRSPEPKAIRGMPGRTPIRLSFRGLRFDRRLFVLRVGAPMSLQPVLNNLALATLTAALGAAQLAGFGAAVRLEYLLYPLAFGLGAGVIAMVGTNIGAGNVKRAERIAWTAAALAASVTGCIGVFGATSPATWISLFTSDAEVHRLGAGYLVISSLAYPFLGLGLTLASAFQAAGRPVWPVLAITSRALVVAVGGWIAVHLTGAGLAGLAVVAASGLIVYGSSLMTAFRVGLWKAPVSNRQN
jgi:Na+-driven multidrug efflux pump